MQRGALTSQFNESSGFFAGIINFFKNLFADIFGQGASASGLASLFNTQSPSEGAPAAPQSAIQSGPQTPAAPPPVISGNTPICFMGDSIANGMAKCYSGPKINLAKDSSGVTISNAAPGPTEALPANAVTLVQVGTNDICHFPADLMTKADLDVKDPALQSRIQTLAQKAVAFAQQGQNPVLLGLNKAEGAYTGNSVWNKPHFTENFNKIVDEVNKAYAAEAAKAGIKFAATDAAITADQVSSDRLHPNQSGLQEMTRICLGA